MKSFSLIKPYILEKRLFILIGILSLIAVDFMQLYIPRIIKRAVDDLTAFRIDLKRLLLYSLYMVGISILIGIFRYIWRRCLIGTSRRVEEGLRNVLFSHIQTLSASYFDNIKTGDLMAHATNDIQHVRMAMGMGMVALTDAVVLGLASIGFMTYINIRLTLLAVIPMPLIIFGTRFFSKKMHSLYKDVQSAFSDLTEVTRERFAGIRIVKAHNREEKETEKVEMISKVNIDRNLKLVRITGSFFPMMLLFSNLSLAIVLFFGGHQTILLTITPGDFVAFINYIGILTWPMMAMGWVTNLIQRGKASLDRINIILQTRPEIYDMPCAKPINQKSRRIVFKKVTFSYQPNKVPVFSKIDIDIAPGTVLGITGPPGSGKTTVLSLVPRLYDISEGNIFFDGTDIRKIRICDLRSQISFMPQEPFLFAGTVRNNIILGNKNVKEEELAIAARKALLYDTIKSFQSGFETIVGEKGVILSGGQKQRIALARILLKDTPVLILDDPISQVDMETGAGIIKNIRLEAYNKTVIISSHRLSAIRFADQIIVLENGKISESGSHDKLLQNNQYYAKTFRLQKIEEELDAF